MWENGVGLEQDFAKAAQLYKAAADVGLAAAQYNLGVLCFEGKGMDKSIEAAKYWFAKSAEQGHKLAKSNLEKLEAGITEIQTREEADAEGERASSN